MNKKNGYTLVEILAVISIIGLLIILLIPYLLKAYYNSKDLLADYNTEELVDSVKLYLADYDLCVKSYTYRGTDNITINGKTYKNGDTMSCYDFKVYAKDGIDITIEDLVTAGYYDKCCTYSCKEENADGSCKIYNSGCTYDENACDLKKECLLKGTVETDNVQNNNNYYVTKKYLGEIVSGCKTDSSKEPFIITNTENYTNKVVVNYSLDDDTKLTKCNFGLEAGNYTIEGKTSEKNCYIDSLKPNEKYYYKLCANNKEEGEICKTGSIITDNFINPSISFDNEPAKPINGYVKKSVASVNFSSENVISPSYYIKSAVSAKINEGKVSATCGNSSSPSSCTSSSSNTLSSGVWYKVNGNVSIIYDKDNTSNSNLYAVVSDGKNYSNFVSATIPKIDLTNPTVSMTNIIKITSGLKLNYNAEDSGSGIKEVTCYYSKDNSYDTVGTSVSSSSCIISNLKNETVYNYKICPTDRMGNKGECITGSTSTEKFEAPTFEFKSTPNTAKNGYVKNETIKVIFSNTNIETPIYYIKSTIDGTTNTNVLASCGNDTVPNACTGENTTSIKGGYWYKVSSDISISYSNECLTNPVVYAYVYDDAGNNLGASYTLHKIDRTKATVSISSTASSTNKVLINYVTSDSYSGVGTVTAYAGKKAGNYDIEATTVTQTSATFTGLKNSTTYYYKICVDDLVGNGEVCTTDIPTTSTKSFGAISLTSTNTPSPLINGFATKSIVNAAFSSDNVDTPTYYIKSTGITSINSATLKECGSGNSPNISGCVSSSKTTLEAGKWYEVNKNDTLTFTEFNSNNAVVYATIYDGNNLASSATITIPKIFYLATETSYTNSIDSSITSVEDALNWLYNKTGAINK